MNADFSIAKILYVIFIDYNPFKGCCNLDSVTCMSPKYMVFHHAFYSGDRSILISYFGRDRDLTIPPGVTHIESSAFSQNKYIQTVSLPQGITHIGNSAFSYCQSLRTIHLPQGLTHIDDLCFNECSSLQSIEIPSSLTHLGIGAFNNCKALPIVSLPQSLIKIGRATFQNCTSLKEVSLNQKLRQISINMFRGCESLKAITLPNNVTEIGDFAFCKCKSLQTISLPNSITKFGVGVFDECGSLSRIGVPYCSKEKFCSSKREMSACGSVSQNCLPPSDLKRSFASASESTYGRERANWAPMPARTTFGAKGSAPPFTSQTCVRPIAHAVRRMVPMFPGSEIRSRIKTNGSTIFSGGATCGFLRIARTPCGFGVSARD